MRTVSVTAIFVVSLGLCAASVAETSAKDANKYRQYVMRGLSSHSGTIGLIAQGKAGNPEHIEFHIQALDRFASELQSVFPKGSDIEGSESLPAIWDEPEEFADAIALFKSAVANLSKEVAGGNMPAIAAAQKDVGKACSGCHDQFRLDED
jgi:cytochrome c556